jgi:signal transduction histidine kinase
MRSPAKALDALIAAAFLAWALAEIATGSVGGPVPVNVFAAALTAVPLAWRRSAPVVTALCCAGGLALKTALGLHLDGTAMLATMLVAAYSVGRHRRPRHAAATLGTMLVLAWLSLFGLPPADQTAANYPFIALWVLAPGIAGAALRHQIEQASRHADRAARAEVQREEHARLAVLSERGRIAREVHDTVAHTVSVMVLHTGAVRSRLPDELRSERDALAQVEATGRQAIAELHRLLGLLRDHDGVPATEPQPTLARLGRLVDDARPAGLEVDVRIEGEPRPLDPALEVSAYRILQEALTNVRRHAHATRVVIRVGYDDHRLRLHVADDGRGLTPPAETGRAGYGLVGIRERVEMYGGDLALSTSSIGGLAIDATLPIGPE